LGEIVGHARSVGKRCVPSTDINAVLQQKAKIRDNTAWQKRLKRVFKARAKQDREIVLNNLCDELETDIRQDRFGSVFRAIRLLSGKTKQVISTIIHTSDGLPCIFEG